MKKRKKTILRVTLFVIIQMLVVTPVFAEVDPGVQFGSWLTRNINGVIPGILGLIGAYLLFMRDWAKALSFFGIAIVVGWFMNWSSIKTLGSSLWTSIFG